MRRSRLPQGGENVLQTIRAKRAEAEARGIKLIDLSIGEPKGPALLSAREAAAEADTDRPLLTLPFRFISRATRKPTALLNLP